jgi:hypothetical protein
VTLLDLSLMSGTGLAEPGRGSLGFWVPEPRSGLRSSPDWVLSQLSGFEFVQVSDEAKLLGSKLTEEFWTQARF